MKSINESSYQTPYTVSNLDTDTPLSFQSWKKNIAGTVLYEQEYDLYNDYLISWYRNKKNTQTDSLTEQKINYLQLLKQIQIYFSREELENWYAGIDTNNEKELILAIPYFSKKLKEIALYYQHLRDSVKKTKIRYNLVGTEKNVVQQLQEIFLSNYTKKSNDVITVPSNVWNSIPELSSISQTLNIEIEELYDNRTYFDRSPTLPVSSYFNFDNEYTEKYFAQKNLSLNNIDWIYRLGQFSLSALYTPQLSSSQLNELSGLIYQIGEQFLGTDRSSTFLVQSSAKKDFYNINIAEGNNFFYWPSGTYKSAIKGTVRYVSTPINDSGLIDVATAGSTLENADTIFVKSKNGVQGAWFYSKEFETRDVVMEARIAANDKTLFRFPFPGFGLSGEDTPWTGYNLVSDPRYFYLDDITKQSIEKVYWETSFELSGISPISINDTTLRDLGAYPNKNYDLADKIRIWNTPPAYNSQIYSGPTQEVWLYKFDKTDLPIASNSNSILQWPLNRVFDTNQNNIEKVPEDICLPEIISDIDFTYSTASNNISSADVVYKLKNYVDPVSQALECAWLSGAEYHYPNIKTKGVHQASFTSTFLPGTFTRFVWNSTNQIDINRVFKGFDNHLPDCKFLNTPNATYEDYELCTCKHTYFSPFGHPGESFNVYPGLADFIVEDTAFNENFDPEKWKDGSDTLFAQSSAACWFKTNSQIGWGNGRWVSNSNAFANNFYLQQGKRYIYYRASIKNTNRNQKQLPEYIIRYKFPENEIIKPIWIRGVQNENGDWISSNEPSTMVFRPGDIINYSRYPTTYFEVTGTQLKNITVLANPVLTEDRVESGSIWSNYTYVTINNDRTPVYVFYPSGNVYYPAEGLTPEYQKQIPVPFTDIRNIVAWSITYPNNIKKSFTNTTFFNFIPTLTGVYSVALTAVTGTSIDNEGFYYFTNIPKITAIGIEAFVPTITASRHLVPGFVLSTPLKGWDYSTNSRRITDLTFIPGNAGGAPYWAKTNLVKSPENDYKGVEAWGGFARAVDTYNIITQPDFATLTLTGGEHFEYQRNYPVNITWSQPLQFKTKVNEKIWCDLKYVTKTPLNYELNIPDLITYPTTTPSTLLLQNYIENEPAEIYYNAINAFTWNITAQPEIQETVFTTPVTSTFLISQSPWLNLFNRNNPTVAVFPSFDKLSSVEEFGTFSTPQNLGILTYVGKDYTYISTLSAINTLEIFEDPTKSINTRGFSKQNSPNIYKISEENNIWLKEPPTTGAQAGTIRNDIHKKYAKFIPYQSNSETNQNSKTGLITPTSRQTPWGGKNDTGWRDTINNPISFTGERNTNAWRDDQILKINGLYLDNWVTDIYGNQFGLYKDIRTTEVKKRVQVGGEIWTRKNSQIVEPGVVSLSSVFNQYKNISLFNDLVEGRINKLSVFYDTLYIETSTAALFEKINYSYTTDTITVETDASRQISLITPTTNNLNREFNTQIAAPLYSKIGDPWFLSKESCAYVPVIELSANFITPKLYCQNINKGNLTLIFPQTENDYHTLYQLVGLNATETTRPVITYNEIKKHFVYSVVVKTPTTKYIIEIHIQNALTPIITSIKVYIPQPEEQLPPQIVDTSLVADVPMNSTFTRQILTNTSNPIFEEVSMPRWASISSSGLFFCNPRAIRDAEFKSYDMQFKVSSSGETAYYSILINVIQ